MGTSGAYGGSGGAWGGSAVNEFTNDPGEETAEQLVGHALEALGADGDGDAQPDVNDLADAIADAARVAPAASAIPGIRIRIRGHGGTGGGGGGGGGGRAGGRGGGRGGRRGRSRAVAAGAGGRALAAGYALRQGDATMLATLGLSLDELRGLSVFDQIKRIVDVTCPATGAPQEAEIRAASIPALIEVLDRGEDDPTAVIRIFVTEFVFEALITECGDRIRKAEANGNRAKDNEALLKDAIRAYADQVDVPATELTAASFKAAIEAVITKAERLVPG